MSSSGTTGSVTITASAPTFVAGMLVGNCGYAMGLGTGAGRQLLGLRRILLSPQQSALL